MKYTVVISLLVASAAGMPSIFGRQDAVGSAVAAFDSLTDSQKADFLEKITQENVANANSNVQGVNNAGAAAPGSGNGKDVQADIKAAAVDDGQANVAINGSSDIQVKANVQGLDDGIVNLNIEGLDDVVVQMNLQAKDGAVANVTVDKGSVAGWGKEGGAACPDNLTAKRVVASMGFCVKK